MTFGEDAEIYLGNLDDNPRIKPRTRHYWRQRLAALIKSWPGLNQTEVRKITPTEFKKWASRYGQTASPMNYNNTAALLRHVLNVAIDAGVIYANPAATLKRGVIRAKEVALPSTDKFNDLIAEMRAGHSRHSQNCADFVAGLAFTGMRKGEANALEWLDVEFERDEIAVRGDAITGTKNWELRRVPLIPDARALFERMRSERPEGEPLDAKVFRVRESQKALDHACKEPEQSALRIMTCGICFATRCIEFGADIPTVSRWLGHKDGAALAMKTYGHLGNEHSIAQATARELHPCSGEAGRHRSVPGVSISMSKARRQRQAARGRMRSRETRLVDVTDTKNFSSKRCSGTSTNTCARRGVSTANLARKRSSFFSRGLDQPQDQEIGSKPAETKALQPEGSSTAGRADKLQSEISTIRILCNTLRN